MALIPITKGKLSVSITIRASTPLQPTVSVYENANNVQISYGKVIGTVQALEREQTREVTRIYTLGENAFEPFRVVPEKITSGLTLKKVVLYTEDVLEALGYAQGNLFYQQSPFILIEEQDAPPSKSNPVLPKTITYYDCWFVSNPIRYDIMTNDQLVVQEARIACGKIVSSEVSFSIPGLDKSIKTLSTGAVKLFKKIF